MTFIATPLAAESRGVDAVLGEQLARRARLVETGDPGKR